jgi:hypothetical protein
MVRCERHATSWYRSWVRMATHGRTVPEPRKQIGTEPHRNANLNTCVWVYHDCQPNDHIGLHSGDCSRDRRSRGCASPRIVSGNGARKLRLCGGVVRRTKKSESGQWIRLMKENRHVHGRWDGCGGACWRRRYGSAGSDHGARCGGGLSGGENDRSGAGCDCDFSSPQRRQSGQHSRHRRCVKHQGSMEC